MFPSIATVAKAYTPTLDEGVLRFRHPWVLGDDKKGKWIRIGVAKLLPTVQGQLLEDAQKLLQKAPFLTSDAPSVDSIVLEPYFRAITRAKPREYDLDYSNSFKPVITDKETGEKTEIPLMDPIPDEYYIVSGAAPDGREEEFYNRYKLGKVVKDHIKRLNNLLAAERRENERLKSVIERLGRTMGEKSDDEKKLKVGECLKHFEKSFRVQEGVSEGQRDDVLRRVKVVLEKLGHEKHYARITENDLIAAVTASGPKTSRERSKRIQYIKRFCTWLCRSTEKGGLGFVGNPGSDLKAEGEKAIQAKRRATGKVSTLDPKPLLNKLPLY
ncbi:MAG: hypothetical protein WCT04_27745 [Planctomycetota bacterium]